MGSRGSSHGIIYGTFNFACPTLLRTHANTAAHVKSHVLSCGHSHPATHPYEYYLVGPMEIPLGLPGISWYIRWDYLVQPLMGYPIPGRIV